MLKNIDGSHRTLIYAAICVMTMLAMGHASKKSMPRASDACMVEQAKISAYVNEENKRELYVVLALLIVIVADYSVVVLSPVFKNAYKEYKAQK